MRTYRLIAEFMRNHVRFLVEFPVALSRSAHGIFIYYFLQSIESAVDMGLGSNFSFQCINFSFQNIKTLTHIVKFNIELNGQRYRKKLESLRVVFIPHTYLTPHVSHSDSWGFFFLRRNESAPR